jgi:hypothetical protein
MGMSCDSLEVFKQMAEMGGRLTQQITEFLEDNMRLRSEIKYEAISVELRLVVALPELVQRSH